MEYLDARNVERFNSNYLSLSNTKILRCFAAVFIIVAHATGFFGIYVSNIATIGVGIFFFTSGFGLTYSLNTKSDFIKTFNRNRWIKLYIPLWVITIITVPIYVYYAGVTFDSLFFTVKYFLTGNHNGFVLQLTTFYVFFYTAFRFMNKNNAVLGVWIMSIMIWFVYQYFDCYMGWYNSTLIFAFGVTWSAYKDKIDSFIRGHYSMVWILTMTIFLYMCYKFDISPKYTENLNFLIMSAIALILVTMMRKVEQNSFFIFVLVMATLLTTVYKFVTGEVHIGLDVLRDISIITIFSSLLMNKEHIVTKNIRNIGSMSYELYLIHWSVLYVLNSIVDDPIYVIILTIILSIVVSIPLKLINDCFVRHAGYTINKLLDQRAPT